MKKLLCLDGGGILGYLTARILQEIETRLPNPMGRDLATHNILVDHFDLVAGTSTGSILAAGITLGLPLSTIVDLYQRRGPEIFESGVTEVLDKAGRMLREGPSNAKFSDRGLAKVLREELRVQPGVEPTLGDLLKPTLIQSFDASLQEPVVFKSYVAAEGDQDFRAVPLWQVVKASCSAPTYFPAHPLEYAGDDKDHCMIDGGVFANNPSLVSVSEVFSGALGDDREILCVSVGTTERSAPPISVHHGREMGIAEWAIPLIRIFMGGAARHVHSLTHRVLTFTHGADRYFRFQIIADQELPIDVTSHDYFRKLDGLVGNYFMDYEGDAARLEQHRKAGYLFGPLVKALLPQMG